MFVDSLLTWLCANFHPSRCRQDADGVAAAAAKPRAIEASATRPTVLPTVLWLAWSTFCGLTWLSIISPAMGQAPSEFSGEQLEFFERHIRPVLAEQCYECHSTRAKTVQAGLLLDSRAGFLKGGDSGPAFVVGKSAESLVIQALKYESFEMPPKRRLEAAIVENFARWIDAGAAWPAEAEPTASSASAGADSAPATAQNREHWCWQPIQSPALPQVHRQDWPAQPLDYFILAKLEAQGLSPTTDADRLALIRRLYFDLIGLPPTPEELQHWSQHASDDWYEELTDQLLKSPHFGEKWARHWLDLVRYAETCGHEFDYPIQEAYTYRDYVIRAFNADVPYDQFVREQLAGDLIPNPRRHPTQDYNESIIGTGFWFLGESIHAPTDVRGDEAARIDNQIDVMSKSILGLTIACARCHNHKFDPISTQDYYALAGFLQSSRRQHAILDSHNQIAQYTQQVAELNERLQPPTRSLVQEEFPTGEEWTRVLQRLSELQREPDGKTRPLQAADVPAGVRWSPEQMSALRAWIWQDRQQQIDSPWYVLRQLWEQLANSPAKTVAQGTPATQTPPPVGSVASLATSGLARKITTQVATLPTAVEPAATELLSETLRGLPAQLHDQRLQSQELATAAPLLTRFDSATYSDVGWAATGFAFGHGPRRESRWYLEQGQLQLAAPNCANSHAGSRLLPGVLRSPEFTLQTQYVHYLMRARNVKIRLTVDGHFMDEYHNLLFADCAPKQIDTQGEFRWITQHQDLDHYVGHQAHIEIADAGDGTCEIAEVRFSADGRVPQPPHGWTEQWLQECADRWQDSAAPLELNSAIAMTCESLGRSWQATCARVTSQTATLEDCQLVNCLLQQQIVHVGSPRAPLDPLANWAAAAADLATAEAAMPPVQRALAITDGSAVNERVHIRGSHRNLGDAVPRRLPEILGGELCGPASGLGSGRLDLANHLLSDQNPLVARVAVNRLWHHLLGRGLVASVDDFGVMGQPPTHPELLDWLANDFRQHGWSLKRQIRQIVLSRTYRQASHTADDKWRTVDPDNLLYSHARLRRLTAEAIRDAMLTVSGRLDRTQFGPSIPVHLTSFMNGRGRPESGPLDGAGRRSIYLEVRRNFLNPFMLTFDMPIPFNTVGRRSLSNVPAQSLMIMNDPLVHEQAKQWAERILAGAPDTETRLAHLFLQALGRLPTERERVTVREFLATQSAGYETADQAPAAQELATWQDLCHSIFNLKEFIFLR